MFSKNSFYFDYWGGCLTVKGMYVHIVDLHGAPPVGFYYPNCITAKKQSQLIGALFSSYILTSAREGDIIQLVQLIQMIQKGVLGWQRRF